MSDVIPDPLWRSARRVSRITYAYWGLSALAFRSPWLTAKENCPDIRNSRVIDVIRELQDYSLDVDVSDPWADAEEVEQEYGIKLLSRIENDIERVMANYDAVVIAVAHRQYAELNLQASEQQIVFDIKALFDRDKVDGRL